MPEVFDKDIKKSELSPHIVELQKKHKQLQDGIKLIEKSISEVADTQKEGGDYLADSEKDLRSDPTSPEFLHYKYLYQGILTVLADSMRRLVERERNLKKELEKVEQQLATALTAEQKPSAIKEIPRAILS